FSVSVYTDPPPTVIYSLSLHDALPIWCWWCTISSALALARPPNLSDRTRTWWELCAEPSLNFARTSRRCVIRTIRSPITGRRKRSEEHTSELQSLRHLVCRLLLEKKKT